MNMKIGTEVRIIMKSGRCYDGKLAAAPVGQIKLVEVTNGDVINGKRLNVVQVCKSDVRLFHGYDDTAVAKMSLWERVRAFFRGLKREAIPTPQWLKDLNPCPHCGVCKPVEVSLDAGKCYCTWCKGTFDINEDSYPEAEKRSAKTNE